MFEPTLEEIPNYTYFLSVDELNLSSKKLANDFPDTVKTLDIGTSANGELIPCLKIGSGHRNALLFGFPHPDEPIGSMTLEYLSLKLARGLAKEFDFTWYIIKCADPDGARMNEQWFKGPFSPLNYALKFYRPPSYQQIEWTFPIRHKRLNWNKPLAETRAIMNLIDSSKPQMMASLHNSVLGGAYFYLTSPCCSLYSKFQDMVMSQNIPIHQGEPETPYLKKLDEGIFKMLNSEESYDFFDRFSDKNPASIINYGTNSSDYAKRKAGSFTIICEVPLFTDPRVADTRQSDVQRKEAILHSVNLRQEDQSFIAKKYCESVKHRTDDKITKRFADAVEDTIKRFPYYNNARAHWSQSDADTDRPATVAEKFDCFVGTYLTNMMSLGLFSHCLKDKENNPIKEEVMQRILQRNQQLEKELSYNIIPIKNLIAAQLGSILITARHIEKQKKKPLF
jgi:hypothetical protein